jgi:peptide/nickel transport system substrate-binding protein
MDEELRHQIVQAIDVDLLVRRNAGRLAVPARGLIPPGLLGYEPHRTKYRGVSASHKRTGENMNLVCILHTIYGGPYASLAAEILNALRRLGFKTEVVEEKAEYADMHEISSRVDINISRWIADYPDADAFGYGMIHTERGLHGEFCGTPEIDRLIENGRIETDPDLRHDIYRRIEDVIAQRALLVPLFHEQTYRFARPEVQGFEFRYSYPTVAYEKLWVRK